MRRLYPPSLSRKTLSTLAKQQKDVDGQADYEASVERCKKLWKNKRSSKLKRAAFDEIRRKLSQMSIGQRCHYCEDSLADEIEHMRPKELYPEDAFQWENYVYACGPCNGPKNNKFAVLDATTGKRVIVTRGRKDPIVPPLVGVQALIDPRIEDPLDFFTLDLSGTFTFVPIEDLANPERFVRAQYTLEVLRLNEREGLVLERRNAFRRYAQLLALYGRTKGESPNAVRQLDEIKASILTERFQSVWASMQRQTIEKTAPARLLQIFARAPEALEW